MTTIEKPMDKLTLLQQEARERLTALLSAARGGGMHRWNDEGIEFLCEIQDKELARAYEAAGRRLEERLQAEYETVKDSPDIWGEDFVDGYASALKDVSIFLTH